MEILRGQVVIDVESARALAELEAATQQLRKNFQEIDQLDAEPEIKLHSKDVRREITEVKRELLNLEKAKANPEIELDDDEFQADVKRVKARLKELNQQKIEIDVDQKELDEYYKGVDRLTKRIEALSRDRKRQLAEETRLTEARNRAADRAVREQIKGYNLMERESRAYGVMQARALAMDEKRSDQLSRQHVLHAQTNRDLAKMRSEYAKLLAQLPKAQRAGMFGGQDAAQELERLTSELELHRQKIRALGGEYKDIKPHEEDQVGRLRKFASSLGSVRLQMGFFSATLRQATAAFTLLGPVIFALAGQIASLIGVVGTGLAGAIAVSAAGLIGFAGAALGVGLIMKPMIGDLQDAKKASDAYGDAVRKYGKNSTEAKTAQEKLNKTLGDVTPEARKAFASMGTLSDRWKELTDVPANRKSFFELFANGIGLANRMLPMFARESNKTFKVAMGAGNDWIKMFSDGEAQAGIQQILSNFRGAITPINSGFINIGQTIGKISASASRHLPSLGQGFETWSSNLFKSLDGGDGLDTRIDRLVEHMRQLGRFAQSAGSMLAAFFSAGANEGATLLNTLTNIMNRWTSWMNSASGQSALGDFFAQANTIGSQFIGTLVKIGVALFELSSAFAPLSQGFLSVVNGISSVVAAFMGLKAAQGVVTALGGALAGAFVASRIAAAATAIGGLVTAIRAVGAASAAASLAGMLNPIFMIAAIVGGAIVALAAFSDQASTAESAMNTLATATARTNQAMNDLAGIETDMATSSLALAGARAAETKAQTAYQAAVAKYGAGSRQARAAQEAYTRAILATNSAQNQMDSATTAHSKNIRTNYAKANGEIIDLLKDQSKAEENLRKARKTDDDEFIQKRIDELASVNRSLDAARAKADKYGEAVERAEFNAMRAGEKTANVTQKIGKAWGNLSNIPFFSSDFGSKIAKIVNPDQAAAVVKITESLRQMGKLGAAKNILGDMTKFDPASINAVIAKLRQVRAEAGKGGKAIITATVKKGTAEKDLGSLGKGKTATINAKANTKNAEKSLKGLSSKQLAARLTIRADNRQAMSALSAVQRARLTAKMVALGANPAAAKAAIASINSQKLSDKTAKFKGDSSDAEAANNRVQGIKDKTVRVRTTADLSGASAAQSAINAIPNTSYKDVITRYSSQGSPGHAAGGPVGFASGGATSPRPAQAQRHAASAERADLRQNRGGIYRRPSLLVGEENRKEFVISTNDSYRSVNEGYLRTAANEFGYDLAPIEMAAGGKVPTKTPKSSTVGRGAQKYIASGQQRYTYLRGEISRLTTQSSDERADQDLDIQAGRREKYMFDPIARPLQKAWGVYGELKAQIQKMIGGSQSSITKSMAVDRSINKNTLKGDKVSIKEARAHETSKRRAENKLRNNEPKSKEKKKAWRENVQNAAKATRAAERATQKAEDRLQSNKDRDRDAKSNVKNQQQSVGDLWRELNQQIPSEMRGITRQLQELQDMKDGKITSDGGTDSPMGIQLGALDKSRYDTWRDFASNVTPAAPSAPGPGLPAAPGVPGSSGGYSTVPGGSASYAAAAAGAGFYAAAGGAAAGLSPATQPKANSFSAPAGGGTTVNQNINISEPPSDPHSFSKQLGWEAAALIG